MANGSCVWTFLGEKGGIPLKTLQKKRTKVTRPPARAMCHAPKQRTRHGPPRSALSPRRPHLASVRPPHRTSPASCLQVNFNLEWADKILTSGISLRKRKPAGLCVMQQDLGLSQTSSFSFIDGEVFGVHDGYEFRRRRKLGGGRKADRLIPTRGRRNVAFVC